MGTESLTESITRNAEKGPRERIVRLFFLSCALLSVATTVSIIVLLATEAAIFFEDVSIVRFLTGTEFYLGADPQFGVLPLVVGTLVITVGAAVIALPLGVATAIYLSEYASTRTRSVLKPALEILAGVPTVVYGFLAVAYITPALEPVVMSLTGEDLGFFNALSASIVVGIMIIPMVSSISEDAMSAVPDELRQAGYGMGATKFDVSTGIVVPAAVSGIASSFILALSRAIGETMAVTIAAGNTPRMVEVATIDLGPVGIPYPDPTIYFKSIQTMTAAMVDIAGSDIAGGGVMYQSLFAIGFTLFAITLVMNIVSDRIAAHYREEY
ncbi:phosphate ABC transporter permease subunit PstC [Halomarina pelagica]|uniref:phosphate ABC transporter permease subunit PstC n=1 Tax=Halomarina pelagica TaxID=2961599 RepID=UPI0020C37E90|nr:phosphate ABC transporter permease subunit PstC [Halomarina sp. BND7]